MRILIGFVLLILALPVTAQDFDAVEIKASQVSGHVWMLEGAGGTLGVSAGEDGIFLIDDQYAPLSPKILAAIAKIQKGSVTFVLNTHWHGDHVGGNENMGKAGALDVAGCEKAASFIVLCDSFNIPLLLLVDTPGFVIGIEGERQKAPGKIINFMQALQMCTVPKLSVILRKSYGQA